MLTPGVLSDNPDGRTSSQRWQNALHVAQAHGNTPGRRLVSRPDQVKEDRRAAVAPARAHIPVEHQADVVEAVASPQFLMARPERSLHQSIIVGIIRLVAPQHILPDMPHRQGRPQKTDPIAPREAVKQLHIRDGCRAVSFALQYAASGSADRRRYRHAPDLHQRPRFLTWLRTHDDCRSGPPGPRPCLLHFPHMFLLCA